MLPELGDPAEWGTGLSPEGARAALELELELIRAGRTDARGGPRRVLIWCAGNVFTAALRWVHRFTELGCAVTLKAPSRRPGPCLAIARAYGARCEVLPHAQAFHLLERAEALLAFGTDAAMAELESRFAGPKSLHGHRLSVALCDEHSDPRALALDLALHDGAGCLSPTVVFAPEPEVLARSLARELSRLAVELPRGPLAPAEGPLWRRRTGLARVTGSCLEGPDWAVCVLPRERFAPLALPRLVTVHPGLPTGLVEGLALSTLAAPVSVLSCHEDLWRGRLGFARGCLIGDMQRPACDDSWEGVDVISKLLEDP